MFALYGFLLLEFFRLHPHGVLNLFFYPLCFLPIGSCLQMFSSGDAAAGGLLVASRGGRQWWRSRLATCRTAPTEHKGPTVSAVLA